MWLDAAWVKKRADISYFHPIYEDKQNLKNFEIPKIKNDEGMFFQDFLFSEVCIKIRIVGLHELS